MYQMTHPLLISLHPFCIPNTSLMHHFCIPNIPLNVMHLKAFQTYPQCIPNESKSQNSPKTLSVPNSTYQNKTGQDSI